LLLLLLLLLLLVWLLGLMQCQLQLHLVVTPPAVKQTAAVALPLPGTSVLSTHQQHVCCKHYQLLR
jgi:hypothetical protein